MIMRMLGQVTPILMAVLLGIAVYAGMQARHYADLAEVGQARAARAESRAEILLEHQRWQREQIESMTATLDERDAQVERDDAIINLVRRAARNLERDDAETGEWADRPIPDAVDGWLLDLPGRDGDSAGGGGAGGAELPGQAPASTKPGSESQP